MDRKMVNFIKEQYPPGTLSLIHISEKPETLHRACDLLQDLDNYQRITEDAYGYGQRCV